MNEKQQQLIFDKGITNVPSDHICPDNALEDAYNLIYNNGQHHVIQKPQQLMTSTPTLLYVHRFNNDARYICVTTSSGTLTTYPLVWGTNDNNSFHQADTPLISYTTATTPKVTSVGKTLIVSDSEGLHYFLWKGNTYLSLGNDIPRPEVDFRLVGGMSIRASESKMATDMLEYDSDTQSLYVPTSKQNDWNNFIIGQYSLLKNRISRKKAFHGSFCVRVALELYDGNYYHISNPILMINQFSSYCMAYLFSELVTMYVHGQTLQYKYEQDYTSWSDIVKNVVIFVTKEANVYDTSLDAICVKGSTLPNASTTPIYYYMEGYRYDNVDNIKIYSNPNYLDTDDDYGHPYQVLSSIPDSDILTTIKDGVYYKLCEIGLKGDTPSTPPVWHEAADHFDTHTIENITTQTQLGEDDYFSHCALRSDIIYPYNSRLNLASVERSVFEGFDNFMPFTKPLTGSANQAAEYTFYVTVDTDSGEKIVSHSATTTQIQGIYFYYPDPRAKHVIIMKGGNSKILDSPLMEHPSLHGAFYFAGISPQMVEPAGLTETPPTVSTDPFELLPNYVITSEVNNPFVFKAEGYNKVGTGRILGLATTTMALSQDAYGRTDLMVFSDSGIWGMAVDRTGLFQSIHPFSREVCNNADSITQTDGAIFFSSAKGLMMATDAGVKCVSTQLSGKTPASYNTGNFCEYIKDSIIAYDYRDSLLWLFKKSASADNNKYYYFVYSIRSGAFSKVMLDHKVMGVVSDYPDSIIQQQFAESATTSTVYSLNNRVDINAEAAATPAVLYSAKLISRPLKLENAIALKTIMHAKHILDITSEAQSSPASLAWKVEASNNTKVWVPLSSLTGMPWKYYRFTYTFTNLRATDTFSGTLVVTQERRTNKMR